MPSPDKDRPSGRLGRLLAALRPSRAGPLPVQTGFPTSLADLVVKNHGRLKKQPSLSSKRRKGGVSAPPSPNPPTSPSPPPSSPPPPPAAAVSPSSDLPRPDLLPSPAVRRDKPGAVGLGLVVSLALLVIWSKKVVAAVTVASFSLFLLESLRRRSPLPRRPPPPPERQLYLDGRGRVSPIREVEAETEPPRASCADSLDASSILSAEEETSGALDESSSSEAKTKRRRSWKKLIASAKKLHSRGRKSNKEAEDCSGSFRSEGDDRADAAVKEPTGSSGSRRAVANETDVVADAAGSEPDWSGSRGGRSSSEIHVSQLEVDAPADLTEKEEEEEEGNDKGSAGIRFPAPVLVAVVLVGLVAGKLPAVAFTVLCAAFFSSVPRFPCGGDGSRWRRLEPPKILVNYSRSG